MSAKRDDRDKRMSAKRDDRDKKMIPKRDDRDKKMVSMRDHQNKKMIPKRDDRDKKMIVGGSFATIAECSPGDDLLQGVGKELRRVLTYSWRSRLRAREHPCSISTDLASCSRSLRARC